MTGEHDFECPLCTHTSFTVVLTVNDDRRLQCQGCDGLFEIDDLEPYHGMQSACVMTPHHAEDDLDGVSLQEAELSDELTSAGYHRKIDWIECYCGEMFYSKRKFDDHLDDHR